MFEKGFRAKVLEKGRSMRMNKLLSNLGMMEDVLMHSSLAEGIESIFEKIVSATEIDAITYLEFDRKFLTPLAVAGLHIDVKGRRFDIDEHPRLLAFCSSVGPVHFDAGCTLPDPFDGLIPDVDFAKDVHDCLGCRVEIGGTVVGVVTMDALNQEVYKDDHLILIKKLSNILSKVVYYYSCSVDVVKVKERPNYVSRSNNSLIGTSNEIATVLEKIKTVAPTEIPVLITGNTGTGKEVVARELHKLSARNLSEMVYINCAALPENLAESELFGYNKGAYTGADQSRMGLFEAANGGTIFLDEVGDLPLSIQVKLLRVLQFGEVQRIGSDKYSKVDVRIIAATNRNLEEMIVRKEFREDLYYRLNAYHIELPCLKNRGKDSLLIAGYFCEEARKRYALKSVIISPELESYILSCEWNGNVRELNHFIDRNVINSLSTSNDGKMVLTVPSIETDSQVVISNLASSTPKVVTLSAAIEEAQVNSIKAALKRNSGVIKRAASDLGVDPSNLRRLIKRLSIRVLD